MAQAAVVLLLALFALAALADETEFDPDEPVEEAPLVDGLEQGSVTESGTTVESELDTDAPEEAADSGPDLATEAASEPIPEVRPFLLLGGETPPGSIRRVAWYADENAEGLPEATPVLVAHGSAPGPVLCLTAAIHGDELNGIEIVRELLYDLEVDRLAGTVIGVPIVNLYGFRQGERYLPDRRDLNRFFPGSPRGSFAARVAHSLFQSIVRRCDYLVDLHTGSFHRTNLTQLRANLNDEGVLHLTRGFGATVVLHDEGAVGTLRRAATEAGIPAVVIEAGQPHRFEPEQVEHGVRALRSAMNHLGMMPGFPLWQEPQPTYYASSWVRAEGHGILSSQVRLGQTVSEGTVLGTVTDPITSARRTIRSPTDGRIIGMALNQTVRPGYAVYHVGIRKSEEELIEEVHEQEALDVMEGVETEDANDG